MAADTTPQVDTQLPEPDSLSLAYLHPGVARLGTLGRSFAANRDAVRRSFAEALSVVVKEEQNPHGPWIDSLFTFTFRESQIELLRAGYDGKEIPMRVTLWSASQGLPGNISVGSSSAAAAARVFGPPAEMRTVGDTLVLKYSAGEAVEDPVELKFVRDTLRVVEWRFYVD